MKSPAIAARNERICELRRAGKKIKEIAAIVEVKDHTVTAALSAAGMTSPNAKQLGPKPSLVQGIVQRGPCLACRKSFRGHSKQFRCDDCATAARSIAVW